MADEIKIENIGGENGVASEVTLVRLVAAMEKMAKTSGNDPKSQSAKTQKAYNKAQENGVKVSTKHRDAVKDNTTAVKNNTKYLNLMGGGLLKLATAGIGAAIGGLKGLTEELISGGDSLSSFAQHIPIVGSTLTMFTGVLDRSYQSFQSMATSGADFGYSLADLRSTAADARLPLETFSSMVAQNSQQLAAFGGTVTQGARQVAGMTNALGSDMLVQLQSMGLSMEQVNEQMSLSAYLNRAGNRSEVQSRAAQAEAAAGLTKNMLILSKLTGEDVKTQQDKLAQAQMDLAFQRELVKLEPAERKKLNAAMAEAQQTGGKVAVDALKAEFLGMPPLTRELQIYTATQQESAKLVSNMLKEALNGQVTLDQYNSGQAERMASYFESQVAAANNLDGVLKAGAVSADGLAGELSSQLGVSSAVLINYMKNTGEGIVFAKDEFLKDYEAGKIVPPKDGELNAMGEFLTAVGEAKKAITNNFINPIVKTLTPVVNSLTASFSGFVGEEGSSTVFQNALDKFSKYMEGTATPAVEKFLKAFGEDPGTATKDAMSGITKSISEFFMGGVDKDGKKFEGFYQKTLAPMFIQMGTDIANGAKEAVIKSLGALFDNPLVVGAMVGGIGLMFGGKKIAAAMALGAGSLFKGLKTPGASPTVTRAPTVGRDPKTGQFTSLKNAPKANPLLSFGKAGLRGLKFVPGVGLVAAGAMGLFDGVGGFNADPDAGFGESLGNAGSSMLNGLTFGLWGSSPQEIAAEAEAKKLEEAEKKDLAKDLGLTTESAKLLERMAGIGGGMEQVAGAFERIDKLERFSENVNAIQKGLDISELSKYNSNMQEIARSLEDMNKALAEDNKGLFGGTGVGASDLIKTMGSGMTEETGKAINITLGQLKGLLTQIKNSNAEIAG